MPGHENAQPQGKTTKQSRRPSGALTLCIIGLAFLWPSTGSSATMSFRHAAAESANLIAGEWHAVVMGAAYALFVIACLATRRPIGRALANTRRCTQIMLCLGCMGAAGRALLAVSPLVAGSPLLSTIAVAVGLVTSAACITGQILVWGCLLARLELPHSVLAVMGSTAVSCTLQLFANAAGSAALLVFLSLCPAVSALAYLALVHFEATPSNESSRPSSRPNSQTAVPQTVPLIKELSGLPWKSLVPIVALIYLEQAFSSVLFTRYPAWPRDNLTVTLAAELLVWAVAWAYAARIRSQVKPFLTALFASLLVFYMAALLATVMFPEGASLVVERLLVAAGSSFRVLLWLAILQAACARKTAPVVGFSAYVFFVLAVPVSRLLSLVFARMDATSLAWMTSPSVIVPVAGATLFLVAAAYVLASTRASQATPQPDVADGPSPAPDEPDKVHLFAERAGLTARETDVLELVCRGYTAKGASEKLGLAESTVVSHMTHIYRKAQVCSKQELVANVEELGS